MRSLVCSVILVLSLAAFHRGHGATLETAFPGTQEEVDNPEDEGMLTIFGTITDDDPPVQDWVKATPQEAVLAEKLREAVEDDDVDSQIARALNVLQSEDMERFARGVNYNQQPYKTADYAPDTSYNADTYGGNTYTTQQYEIPQYEEPYTEEVDYEGAPQSYEDAPQEYQEVPDDSYPEEYDARPQPEPYEKEAYVEPEQPYTEAAYPGGTYTEDKYPTDTYDQEETYTDEAYPPEEYPEQTYAAEKYPEAPYPVEPYPQQEETYQEQPGYPPAEVTYPAQPYPAGEDYAPEAAGSYPNVGRSGMNKVPANEKYKTNYKPATAPKKAYPTATKQYPAKPTPSKAYSKPMKQYTATPPPSKVYPQQAGYSGNPCNDKRDQNKCNGYGVTLAWYYDGTAKTCRAYFDKGCKQSKNIFKERADCTKKCGGDRKPDSYYAEAQKRYGLLGPSTCLHPRSAGNGREQYLSWYFDRETLYCKPFVFSGYFGNANRYDSREQCIQICSVHMKPKAPAYPAPNKKYTAPAPMYPPSKYPAQKYPAQKYPEQKYPEQKYPAQKYPAQKYPAQKYPAQKYPAPAPTYPAMPPPKYPATKYPQSKA